MIKVIVNGKDMFTQQGINLIDLIKSYHLNCLTVIVELNGSIIEQNEYAKCLLKDNDKIELINFVGGG